MGNFCGAMFTKFDICEVKRRETETENGEKMKLRKQIEFYNNNFFVKNINIRI